MQILLVLASSCKSSMGDFLDIPGSSDVVGRLPGSNVYHLVRKQINDNRMDLVSICGNLEGDTIASPKMDPEFPTLKKANNDGLRLCETCKTNLRMYADEEINTCTVCNRVSVLTTDIFRTITIPEGPNSGSEGSICKPCRLEIVTINEPTLSE